MVTKTPSVKFYINYGGGGGGYSTPPIQHPTHEAAGYKNWINAPS